MFLSLTDYDGTPLTLNCEDVAVRPTRWSEIKGSVIHTPRGTFVVQESYAIVSCLLREGNSKEKRIREKKEKEEEQE